MLEEYRRKRDFKKTPEPKGISGHAGAGLRYVVQKHDASHLHYDFRLQIGDVLASWAVPKGPSLDPTHKRLAVHVEDHPLDYGDFEGTIPKGQYGGGTVMLWDTGTWIPEAADPTRAIKQGKLVFTLNGARLKGGWTLTRMRSASESADHENWLLIKRDDEAARHNGPSIVDEFTVGVRSGRSMEEIAGTRNANEGKGSARARDKTEPEPTQPAPTLPEPTQPGPTFPKPKATKATRAASHRPAPKMPAIVTPQLCTLADRAPTGADWVHEIKFDGYRLLCRLESGKVALITRSGKDWTHRFPPLRDAIAKLDASSALIDGEATILDESGRTSFQDLQNAIKAGRFNRLAFFAFDLLYHDGVDLRQRPLIERKSLLEKLVATHPGIVRYSEHVAGSGNQVQRNACELALEGIVCKQIDAPYVSGRSRTWLKVKCSRRQEFIVIGWSAPEGARKHFGSLLLATRDSEDRLIYTGRVGTGFTAATLRDVKARLDALARGSCPADEPPTREESRGVHWVEPTLVAEVTFTQLTDDGRLRHPSFEGLRDDKPASAVHMESPTPVEELLVPAKKPNARRTPQSPAAKNAPAARTRRQAAPPAAKKAPSTSTIQLPKPIKGEDRVGDVRITHADRVIYPDAGITKLQVARYYDRVADAMLPYLVDRPLSTVRCPGGQTGQCFFQKHMRATFGPPVKGLAVVEDGETVEYISVDSRAGLVALIQYGVLEIHPWGARLPDLEKPDQLTFDLDPGDGVPFDAVKDAATLLRRVLESAGLVGFLKASGGKGLHVVAPLAPKANWDHAKAFCADVAKRLAKESPDRFIAVASKSQRRGRIFIDYLRNSRGATSVAPYSTRSRPGASVAVPMSWRELRGLDRADAFSIDDMVRRLERQRSDPWASYESSRQPMR